MDSRPLARTRVGYRTREPVSPTAVHATEPLAQTHRCSLVKEIRMGSCARCREDELVSIYRIHEQSVRHDMTFSKPPITSSQSVIPMPFLQRKARAQTVDHAAQGPHIVPALLGPFVILLKLGRRNKLIRHGGPYSSSAANISSTESYDSALTLPLMMSRASRMALSVVLL